jgi:hypothetical protein
MRLDELEKHNTLELANWEARTMKKLITAVLAILMLAGALCAINGANSNGPFHSVAIVGEGTSPFPVLLTSSGSPTETTLANHF